jgi:hypothetical protein
MVSRGRKAMTVFYRGPRALITHRTIEVWYVHVIGASPTQVDRAIRGSSGLAGVVAVVLSTRWLAVPMPLVALAVLVVAGVAAGACLRVRTGPQELRAVYRGQMVSLFGSVDAREFGQVRRAVVRALENVTDR